MITRIIGYTALVLGMIALVAWLVAHAATLLIAYPSY